MVHESTGAACAWEMVLTGFVLQRTMLAHLAARMRERTELEGEEGHTGPMVLTEEDCTVSCSSRNFRRQDAKANETLYSR